MDVSWDDYYKCSAECGYEIDDWGDVTKLLGYPDTIQSPMEEECESVSRGEPLDYVYVWGLWASVFLDQKTRFAKSGL